MKMNIFEMNNSGNDISRYEQALNVVGSCLHAISTSMMIKFTHRRHEAQAKRIGFSERDLYDCLYSDTDDDNNNNVHIYECFLVISL